MVMAKMTNARYDTLSDALSIIDPQGTLTPGTVEHNTVTETILSWMDTLEHDEVLRMSEITRRMFRYRRHIWQ
jgi:hypothetical protein